jgi:trigger factor
VGEETFAPAVERNLRKRSAQITLPGFRKGKAPRNLIVQSYGMGVFIEDAVNELYPTAYNEAVLEANIEPVEAADIEILSVDDKGFTFKATVAVKPEAELGQYKGLEVTRILVPVDESRIDEQLSATRERNARMVTVTDRPAKEGDTAIIDFEGFVDDVPFEGGKGENYPLVLGSGTFIPGFEEQIVGKEIEQPFDVNVTFPEAYGVPELNGKPAVFKVVIHELKEKQLPELDDEFAKDVSEFDTLAEYRADIRAKLEETAKQNADITVENELMKSVVANMKVDLPQAMIENRIDDLVRDFEHRLRMQGLNMEQFLQYTGEGVEGFRSTFAPQAEQQVLVRLALEAIVKAEGITPTEEQLEAEYTRLSELHGIEVSRIKEMVPPADMTLDLACNMAIDVVKSHAVITESTGESAEDDADEATDTADESKKKTKKTTKKEAEEAEEKPAPKKRTAKPKAKAKESDEAKESAEAKETPEAE